MDRLAPWQARTQPRWASERRMVQPEASALLMGTPWVSNGTMTQPLRLRAEHTALRPSALRTVLRVALNPVSGPAPRTSVREARAHLARSVKPAEAAVGLAPAATA